MASVVIIGGAPKTGKSYIAKRIVKQNRAELVELDELMSLFNTAISNKDFADKLPVWNAKKEKRTPLYSDYQIEASTYWPEIKKLLDRAVKGGRPVVIEGAQLSPKLLNKWLNVNSKREVEVFFLKEDGVKYSDDFAQDARTSGLKVLSRSEAQSNLREQLKKTQE